MELIDQARQRMDNWHLGQTSARRESGGHGPGTVSTGVGDHGGISYGTYQFSSKMGTAAEYIGASRYGNRFAGLEPGTPEFGAKWKEVAAVDPAGFAQDQHDFIRAQHYDKQMQHLQDVGIDLSGRGAAVQDALWSTSVQYRDLTTAVFQSGLKAAYGEDYKLAELTDEQVIRAAQDYKIANVALNFKSSPRLWPSLSDRAISEKADLVALARHDEVNRHPEHYQGMDYQQAFGEPEPPHSQGHGSMADGVMVLGERGPEVEVLQNKLIQAGYTGRNNQPLSADERYGPNTEHAVREFQKAHGLKVDGKAGSNTLDALDNAIRQQATTDTPPAPPEQRTDSVPTETSTPAQQQHALGRDLTTGERIRVIEPFGSADNKVNRTIPHGTSGEDAFRDLQIHHPKTNREAVRTGNAALADRPSQMMEGKLETVRTNGDRNGIALVRKDLILTNQEGKRSVMIPNPVAGYVEIQHNRWNSVSIWSQPAGHPERELLGQVLHGERGSSPYKTGDYVQYGAPLIRQSNAGTGAVHTHIELEPDQFRKYLGDMLNDRLTLSQDTASRNPSTRSAMADGMLTRTERGGEVRAMQEKLAGLGYRGQAGRPLASTGYFGDDTFAAVQAFQRANGLKDDGKAGSKTLAALDAATEAKRQHAAGPDMRDASSADNARFQQAMEKLQDMEKQRAHARLQPLFADNQQLERTAGQLVLASKAAGMDRIDSVVARLDGTGVFAVQGAMNDPASRRVAVEYEQAIAQSVEASSRQSEQVNSQRHDQQDAQEHSRARGM